MRFLLDLVLFTALFSLHSVESFSTGVASEGTGKTNFISIIYVEYMFNYNLILHKCFVMLPDSKYTETRLLAESEITNNNDPAKEGSPLLLGKYMKPPSMFED